MHPVGRLLGALSLALAVACRQAPAPAPGAASNPAASSAPSDATYVGGAACVSCHSKEAAVWQPSQHARAMMTAGPHSVVGRFTGTYRYNGITSSFATKNGAFVVSTDGPDGTMHEYSVAYTFGVEPLQQYLVAFPRGRVQALSLAWDSRPAKAGGQRWFHLNPGLKVDFRDVLHWTGPAENWNYMCADCHSTNLQKKYAAATDSYATTWTDMNVSCEACHGPGSRHVEWARGTPRSSDPLLGLVVSLKDTSGGTWQMPSYGGIAHRTVPLPSHAEIEMCARCHSRRAQVWPEYRFDRPLADTYRVSWLEEGLYFADGQQQDEVYNYGSFLQSKMYDFGVTCSNCHNPHTGKLVAAGNALCAQCHRQEMYDQPTHLFHRTGSAGAECVSCHMPATTYMVVDPRRDHGFKIPRPDETVAYGVPNACNRCHRDKTPQWAAAAVRRWYGPKAATRPSWTATIARARAATLPSPAPLLDLIADSKTPAIVRATAVSLLVGYRGQDAAVRRAAADEDPLVRRAAASVLEAIEPASRLAIGLQLAADPVRTVRLDAVMPLAQVPASLFTPDERQKFDRAAAEYRAAQEFNADTAPSLVSLGALDQALGHLDAAERQYRTALARQPQFLPAYLNLADLYRQRGQEDSARQTLAQGLAVVPDSADLHHALGLALVRQHRAPDALAEFAKAVSLAPGDARYVYVYAVALHDTGHAAEARRVLETAVAKQPANADLLSALVSYAREAGDSAAEKRWSDQLGRVTPAR